MFDMKMRDRIDEMKKEGATHSSGLLAYAENIEEAEEYLDLFPVDGRGFASDVVIRVASLALARQMLATAGYPPIKDYFSQKGDFRAQIGCRDRQEEARISLTSTKGMRAYASGEGGYLPPGDRPDV